MEPKLGLPDFKKHPVLCIISGLVGLMIWHFHKLEWRELDDVQTHSSIPQSNLVSHRYIIEFYPPLFMTLNTLSLIWKYASHPREMNGYNVISLQKEDTWDWSCFGPSTIHSLPYLPNWYEQVPKAQCSLKKRTHEEDFIVWKGSWFWLFTHFGAIKSPRRRFCDFFYHLGSLVVLYMNNLNI